MFNNSSHIDASHSTFSEVHRDQFYNARSTVQGNQTVNTIIHGNQILQDSHSNLIETLQKASALSASHDSAQRYPAPKCIEGTRVELLARLTSWADELDQKPICWLNGRPGSGKSAVSQTVAEKYASQGRLAASFFFSRRDLERRTTHHVVPTLTIQFFTFLPSIRPAVIAALENDLMLPMKVLREQMEKLLFGPLSTATEKLDAPFLIVIDALDECDDEGLVSELVTLLALLLGKTPLSVRLLITSRPEPWLQSLFHQQDISSHALSLDIHAFGAEADIRSFLRQSLDEAYEQHSQVMKEIPRPWPSPDALEYIVNKAGGLFIFALTVVKFIGDKMHHPVERLQAILGEKALGSDKSAYTDLDALYRDAIAVFPDPDVARLVLGVVYSLVIPISISGLQKLLHRPDVDARIIIPSLNSVLFASEDGKQPIQFYHASFRDFLVSPQRSQKYAINPAIYHRLMAQLCFETMSNSLKPDMCGIGDPSKANTEIPDLSERRQAAFDEALLYACRFWAHHLTQIPSGEVANEALDALKKFSTTVLLCWIEALSLFGELENAVVMLRKAISWLKTLHEAPVAVLTLLQDADRVIVLYMDCITECALHIYHSAISFLPRNSTFYKTFRSQSSGNMVSHPDFLVGWDPLRTILTLHSPLHSVAFSPNGELIATAGVEHGVRLWNVVTGRNVASLVDHSSTLLVRFSPSGLLLAAAFEDGTVTVWDPKVGREHLKHESCHSKQITCLEFSENSALLASGSRDNAIQVWSMETTQALYRLAAHEGAVICLVFSSDSLRLVSGAEDNLLIVWDVSTGKLVRGMTGHRRPVNCIALSKNGSIIASGSEDKTVKTWDANSGECTQTFSKGYHSGIRTIRFFDEDKYIITACNEAVITWTIASRNTSHTIWTAEQFFSSALKRLPIWQANVMGWGTPKPMLGYILRLTYTEPAARRLTMAYAAHSPAFMFSNLDLLFVGSLPSQVDGNSLPLGSAEGISAVAISSDGNWAAITSSLGLLQVYDLTVPKSTWVELERRVKSNPLYVAEHFVSSLNGARFIVGTALQWSLVDADYHVVNKINMGVLGTFRDEDKIRFKFSANGNIFFCVVSSLISDHRSTLRVFDSVSGEQRTQFKGLKNVDCFVASQDGAWIACGYGSGQVDIFDVESKKRTSVTESSDSPFNVLVFSDDGRELLGGSKSGVVRIWDRASRTCKATLEVATSMVTALAHVGTPNEARVAIGREDGSVGLWFPSTSTSHDIVRADQAKVKHVDLVQFAEDGAKLRSRGEDGTVSTWAIEFDADDAGVERCALCAREESKDGDSNPLPHFICQSEPEDVLDNFLRTAYRARKDGWIVKGDRRVLWLPQFLRPRNKGGFYPYEGGRVAIWTPSAKLLFIKWDE